MSKYGAACDNLISAQLVMVDGKQVEASQNSNPDLFWAIRGGGGNFGVATALEYRLHPVTDVLAGTLTYLPGRTLTEMIFEIDGEPVAAVVTNNAVKGPSDVAFFSALIYAGVPEHPEGHEVVVKSLRILALQ